LFSSRRRHTIFSRDWSSDVCSSDLAIGLGQQACTSMLGSLRIARALLRDEPELGRILCVSADRFPDGAEHEQAYNLISDGAAARSEERRVGKEWRGGGPDGER